MRAAVLAALAAVTVIIAAGSAAPPARASTSIQLVHVTNGLVHPTAIVSAGDARLFVTEQPGRVRVIDGTGALLPTPFLDVSSLVSVSNEQGLLGLAFHPNYPTTPYFYIDYTDTSGRVVIARYQVSVGNANVADSTSAVIMKQINHPGFTNHNGGQLAFGPDSMLYVGVGDGGSSGDPPNNAQSLGTLLGKILRLDVGNPPMYIPSNNPFVSTPGAMGEIWAYGLRNPWRFSFDRATGDLLIGDVGQDEWEEIDFQPAGSVGGRNYGWRLKEGNHCYNPASGCDPGGLTAPILEYTHVNGGDCSVIGGMRYRGAVAGFVGTYVYGDYCSGRIWGATLSGSVWTSNLLLDTPYLISAFGEAPSGQLYLADYGGGAIYRIEPAVTSVGGIAELPSVTASPSSHSSPMLIGAMAAALALIAALIPVAWRRR